MAKFGSQLSTVITDGTYERIEMEKGRRAEGTTQADVVRDLLAIGLAVIEAARSEGVDVALTIGAMREPTVARAALRAARVQAVAEIG